MGLTLPAQISATAAAALGTSWPQVDEDSVDGLAATFDRCADELNSHALDADRHTQGVLAASSGGLASGLAHASAALVGAADSTAATTAAQLRTAASELVSHAAEVRGTKVGFIHDLSTLTERLAMLHAIGPLTAGGSTLLPADEVDQAAQGIAHRHAQLVQALGGTGLPADVIPEHGNPEHGNPEHGNPVAGLLVSAPDAGATATSTLSPAGGGPVDGPEHAAPVLGLPGPDAHPGGLPDVAPVTGNVAGVLGTGIAAGVQPAEPPMGPGDPAGPPPAGLSHASPGVGGLAGVSTQAAAAQDLAPAPRATALPATVLGPGSSEAGTPTAATFGPAGGGSAGGAVTGGPVVGGSAVGGGPVGGAPVALPSSGPAGGRSFVGVGPEQLSAGAPTGTPPGSAPPRPTQGPGAVALGSAALPGTTTAALARPAAAVVVDGAPAPGGPADAQALAARTDDPSVLLLFVAFPAGTAPVRTARPARQLPPPVREARPGLCCPPGDHPAQPDLALPRQPGPVPVPVPVEGTDLLHGWDPLGGGHERDLERRFIVRPATRGHPAEHHWPPSELHPEGAVAPDRRRPVRLEVGALLDLLGSPEGRVLAEGGTPFAQRAEPAANAGRPLRRLRVARALPAWESHLCAWFAQPGGGLRYRLTHPVAELVATGWLVDAGAGEPRGR